MGLWDGEAKGSSISGEIVLFVEKLGRMGIKLYAEAIRAEGNNFFGAGVVKARSDA